MEGLEKIRQQHRVLDFKYAIAPQQSYVPNPALDTGNFEIKQSGVSLQLDLLHEEQLIDFIELLRKNIKGWFIIEHCTLDRTGTAGASGTALGSIIGAQLKADCAGGWLTMNNKNVP
jgi:hypothetical protein